MNLEELRKAKGQLELIADAVNEFRNTTGIAPCSIDVQMVRMDTLMNQLPDYVLSDVSVKISL